MNPHRKNYPAFPTGPQDSDCISLLEYFAAQAPPVAPEWFRPNMPPQPKDYVYNDFIKDLSEQDEEEFYKVWNLEYEDWPEKFHHILKQIQEINIARYEWREQYTREVSFQWPGYYAEQVILRLEKQKEVTMK